MHIRRDNLWHPLKLSKIWRYTTAVSTVFDLVRSHVHARIAE